MGLGVWLRCGSGYSGGPYGAGGAVVCWVGASSCRPIGR